MSTLDDLFSSVLAPVANETDPTKGAALVGYEGDNVKDALDQLNQKVTTGRVVTVVAATSNGQTLFPVPGGYPVNLSDVYVLGARLINGVDFSATDGLNVTVSASVASRIATGVNLVVESFGAFAVANAIAASTLGASGGAALVGYGAQTVKQALDAVNNGTAASAGALTGTESVPTSRGAGLLDTTWNSVAAFDQATYTSALVPAVGVSRTLIARLIDNEASLNEFYLAGYTDDQAWNAALTWCAANGKTLYVPYKSGGYTWTTAKVWNNHVHSVRIESGTQINVSGITGYALKVQALFSDSFGTQHAFRNTWKGGLLSGTRTTGQHALLVGDDTGQVYTGGLANIQDFAIRNFDIAMGFGSNAFQVKFAGVVVDACNTCQYVLPGVQNTGENMSFVQCQFLGAVQVANLSAGGWFNYINCSFDYFTAYSIACSAGTQVSIVGGHTESLADVDYWYKTQDSQSKINFTGGHVLYVPASVATKTFPFFNGGNADGGIYADSLEVAGNSNPGWYVPAVLGVGFCYIDSISTLGPSSTPYSFKRVVATSQQNLLADGGFEDANLSWRRVDWHLANTNNADVGFDTTTFQSGTQSLKIAPATGRKVTMICTRACGPGSWPILSGYFKAANLQTGDLILVTAQYFDAAGVATESQMSPPLLQFNWNSTNFPTTWTQFNWSAALPAPSGSAYVQFTINNAASVNGTATYWFDSLNLAMMNASLPATSFVGRSFTFTPVVSGASTTGVGTYTTQLGWAEIHGSRVDFNIQLTWSAHTGNGGIQLSGLPFQCDYNLSCAVSIRMVGIPFTGPIVQGFVGPGTNTIVINQLATTGVESQIGLPSTGTIEISGSYQKI